MKTILTAIVVAFIGLSVCVTEGAVVIGDVAIVRVNATTDGFSVLALRDLDASETLFATDNGWLAIGGFRTGEGQGNVDILTATISRGTVFDLTSAGTGFSLAAAGDQIVLFTGTLASPTLIYAVDWANGQGWDADATDSNESADPAVAPAGSPPLPDRSTISLPSGDSYKYTGTLTGTPDELLDAIGNAANWALTDDISWVDGNFSVVPEPAEWGLICAVGLLGVCGLHTWRERRRALRQSSSVS